MSEKEPERACEVLAATDAAKWEAAQTRAFLHWVNTILKRRDIKLTDLLGGFETGVNLIHLVEILTGRPIQQKWSKNPNTRIHMIANANLALQHLKDSGVQKLMVSAENFANADPRWLNLTLGFCWQLLRAFQEPPAEDGAGSSGDSFGDNLLRWVKTTLKDYGDIDLRDGFRSESFRNGKVFAGLINEFDDSFINYKSLASGAHAFAENCKYALDTAENKMGIPSILDHTDLSSGKCNDKQLQLYLSLMYNSYKEKDLGMTKESLMKRVQELEHKLVLLQEENVSLKLSIEQALKSHSTLNETLELKSEEHSKVRRAKEDLTTKFTLLQEQFDQDKLRWENELSKLKNEKAKLSENSDAETSRLQQAWESASAHRDAIRDELRKTKEELFREREQLESEQKKLLSKLERAKKTKESLENVMSSSESNHAKVGPVLTKSVIQHANSMNHWIPILEESRRLEHKDVVVPAAGDILKKDYDHQLEALSQLLQLQNRDLDKLLRERTEEAREVVSVAMGKLKKRVRTAKEIEEGGGSSSEEEYVEEKKEVISKKSGKK